MIHIRQAQLTDAPQIIEVMQNAEASGFMLFNPGERNISVSGCEKMIVAFQEDFRSALFVAQLEDKIVGYFIIKSEGPSRVSHRAYIVIGVHEAARGQGVGHALFEAGIKWAKEVPLHRLELTVIANNEAAVHLYQRVGFEIEGTKKHSLLIDGQYVDEYYMSLLLS